MAQQTNPSPPGGGGSTSGGGSKDDDTNFTLGADNDYAIRYNTSASALELYDLKNNTGIQLPQNLDFSLGDIPTDQLTNASFTITPGNALTGGGSVELGNLLSIAIDAGAIALDELDESIQVGWKQQHTFTPSIIANGDVDVGGRILRNFASVSGDFQTDGENIVFVDSSTGAHTITLSDADTTAGNAIGIVDVGGSAETNNITVATQSSQTINGNATATIARDYTTNVYISDGSNWFNRNISKVGGFKDSDADGIAELLPIHTGIQLDDDEEIQLSSNGSILAKFDSSSTDVEFVGVSGSVLLGLDESTGDLSVLGSLGLEDDNELKLSSDGSVLFSFSSNNNQIELIGNSASTILNTSTGNISNSGNIGINSDNEFQLSTDGNVGLKFESSTDDIRFTGGSTVATTSLLSQFNAPASFVRGLGIGSSNCIWVTDSTSGPGSIYKTDQSGNIQSQIISPSDFPTGIDLDSSSSLWVAGANTGKIHKLINSGSILTSFSTPCGSPQGVGIDNDNCIWVNDGCIFKLDRNGSIIESLTNVGSNPIGLGINSNGSIWIGDNTTSDSLFLLDQSGSTIGQFDISSSGITGVDVDTDDCVWYADTNTDSIFNITGQGDTTDIAAINRTTGDITIDGTYREANALFAAAGDNLAQMLARVGHPPATIEKETSVDDSRATMNSRRQGLIY